MPPANRLSASLAELNEELISELLPELHAAEQVMFLRLEADVAERLDVDQRRIRNLIERLAMVSDAAMLRRPRASTSRRVRLVLDELDASLKLLESDQEQALAQLRAALPATQLAHVADSFATVKREAKKHIMLVGETEVPITEAHVFRRRPDLGRAYAASLDALERRSKGR